jgi:hypothetical protein
MKKMVRKLLQLYDTIRSTFGPISADPLIPSVNPFHDPLSGHVQGA